MYGIYIPGKRPCRAKSLVMFKRPQVLTQDTMVYACINAKLCTHVHPTITIPLKHLYIRTKALYRIKGHLCGCFCRVEDNTCTISHKSFNNNDKIILLRYFKTNTMLHNLVGHT